MCNDSPKFQTVNFLHAKNQSQYALISLLGNNFCSLQGRLLCTNLTNILHSFRSTIVQKHTTK